jgi:hypothetical protein
MSITKESIMSKVESLLSDTITVVDPTIAATLNNATGELQYTNKTVSKYSVLVTSDLEEVLGALATAIVYQIEQEGLKAKTLDVTG